MPEKYNQCMSIALQRLSPVLRAALTLNRDLSLRDADYATANQILNCIALPSAILDRHLTVRFANSNCVTAFERGDLIRLGMNDKFRVTEPAVESRLVHAVVEMCRTGGEVHRDLPIHAGDGTIAAVLSLFAIESPHGSSNLPWLFSPERLVLVIVRLVSQAPLVGEEVLQHVFKLTPAEARLALRLAAGDTLERAAEQFGISRQTGRSQLKAIFLKTQVHRQAELVALLARLGKVPLEDQSSHPAG